MSSELGEFLWKGEDKIIINLLPSKSCRDRLWNTGYELAGVLSRDLVLEKRFCSHDQVQCINGLIHCRRKYCVGVAGGAIYKTLLMQFRSKPLRCCNSFFSGEGGEGGGAHTPEDRTLPAIICY